MTDMITLEEFKAADLIEICSDPVDESITLEFAAKWGPLAERNLSYTAMFEGKAIAMVGIIINRPGVGNVWAIFHNDGRKHIKTLLRSFRTMIEDFILPSVDLRLRALSRADFAGSQLLLEHLGFKRKGLRNGQYLYVR